MLIESLISLSHYADSPPSPILHRQLRLFLHIISLCVFVNLSLNSQWCLNGCIVCYVSLKHFKVQMKDIAVFSLQLAAVGVLCSSTTFNRKREPKPADVFFFFFLSAFVLLKSAGLSLKSTNSVTTYNIPVFLFLYI